MQVILLFFKNKKDENTQACKLKNGLSIMILLHWIIKVTLFKIVVKLLNYPQ